MKHISPEGLDRIEPLLQSIRKLNAEGLKEKKRGVWYRKSKAFLHFHEDPAGIFADLKHDDGIFHRFPTHTAKECTTLVNKIRDLATT